MRKRLAHVVDGERRDRGARQRFHLDAGAVVHGGRAATMSASRPAGAISMSQRSRPSGWQNGMSSCVRFAAIVPATIAVWNTGPFAVRSRRPRARRTRRAGSAARFGLGDAQRRRLSRSRRPSRARRPRRRGTAVFASSANVVHLDLARPRVARGRARAARCSGPRAPPGRADHAAQLLDRPRRRAAPRGNPCRGREQAGVEHAVRGQPRARAVAAERLRDGRDEADLAGAVRIGVALGDLAAAAPAPAARAASARRSRRAIRATGRPAPAASRCGCRRPCIR